MYSICERKEARVKNAVFPSSYRKISTNRWFWDFIFSRVRASVSVDILVIVEGLNWGDKMASSIARDMKAGTQGERQASVRELTEVDSEGDTLAMTP